MADIVVVTGASGFIAGELVKQLLVRETYLLSRSCHHTFIHCVTDSGLQVKGYTVRGTVRSLGNEQKVAHLIALGKALPGKFLRYFCVLQSY